MKEKDIRENIDQVIEIFEVFHPEAAKNEVLNLVKAHSRHNFDILDRLWQTNPMYFPTKSLISIFCENTSFSGETLIDALTKYAVSPKFPQLLDLYSKENFYPTFIQLYNSLTSKTLAEQIITKFIKGGVQQASVEWARLLNEALEICQIGYSESLKKSDVTKILASEMLSSYATKRFADFPISLIVDVRGQRIEHLLTLK